MNFIQYNSLRACCVSGVLQVLTIQQLGVSRGRKKKLPIYRSDIRAVHEANAVGTQSRG